MTELESFRAEKDRFFASHPQSPLTPEQRRHFNGLEYFPENPALRFEAAIEEFLHKDQIDMQTTAGTIQVYTRYGRFRFAVNGQEVELTLFSGPHGFFLPFVDSLADVETYGAGRYVEPEPSGNGKFLIDFNMAYNPYCAYNDNWVCPLPPRENRLNLPIRAGEKMFHHETYPALKAHDG